MNPVAIISVEGAGGIHFAELLSKDKRVKYFGNIYSRKTEPKAEWYEWIQTQIYQDSHIHFKKDRLDLQSAFMMTLFLRTDVSKKDTLLVYIDLMDLEEYHEVLDLFKMAKFKIIHFRRQNLVDIMVNNAIQPIVINIQDTVRKMMLIEKQQELLKEELLTREIAVLDVSYEEGFTAWNRIGEFLGFKNIDYGPFEESKHSKEMIKNYDEFVRALQYTEFANMV